MMKSSIKNTGPARIPFTLHHVYIDRIRYTLYILHVDYISIINGNIKYKEYIMIQSYGRKPGKNPGSHRPSKKGAAPGSAGVLIIILLLCTAGTRLVSQEMHYTGTAGGVNTEETWTLTKDSSGISLYATGEAMSMLSVFQPDGTGIRQVYDMPREGKKLTAEREGNSLILKGTDGKGKIIDKKINLKKKWLSSYSMMTEFVGSSKTEMEFCFIIPMDFSLVDMKAVKEKEEIIQINGLPVETVKVKITLPGFMGKFWSSYFWYRKDDGLFVKSEENRGGPGAPLICIQLASVQ